MWAYSHPLFLLGKSGSVIVFEKSAHFIYIFQSSCLQSSSSCSSLPPFLSDILRSTFFLFLLPILPEDCPSCQCRETETKILAIQCVFTYLPAYRNCFSKKKKKGRREANSVSRKTLFSPNEGVHQSPHIKAAQPAHGTIQVHDCKETHLCSHASPPTWVAMNKWK